jgi:hypothetical protein
MKILAMFLILTLMLTACGTPPPTPVMTQPPASSSDGGAGAPVENVSQPSPAVPTSEAEVHSDAPHTSDVDHTHVPLGDGKLSSAPQSGYLWSCRQHDNVSTSGSFPWHNGDGTWDMTKKLTVDGSVTWTSLFAVSVEGGQRVFRMNDLPSHPTGLFPIGANDPLCCNCPRIHRLRRSPRAWAARWESCFRA